MLLKLERSQRDAGLLGNTVMFCLDARVEFTPPERHSINRYKLGGLSIYNSQAQHSAAEASAMSAARAKAQGIDINSVDGFLSSASSKLGHGLKAAAMGAISAMRLNITVASLERGQHVECKSMDELLGAEDAIMAACENLRVYLDTAATFDGRTVVIEFTTGGGAQVVAQTAVPAAALAPAMPMSAPPAALPGPAPAPTDYASYEQIEEPAYASAYEAAPQEDEISWIDDPLYRLSKWWEEEEPAMRWTVVVFIGFVLFVLLLAFL